MRLRFVRPSGTKMARGSRLPSDESLGYYDRPYGPKSCKGFTINHDLCETLHCERIGPHTWASVYGGQSSDYYGRMACAKQQVCRYKQRMFASHPSVIATVAELADAPRPSFGQCGENLPLKGPKT